MRLTIVKKNLLEFGFLVAEENSHWGYGCGEDYRIELEARGEKLEIQTAVYPHIRVGEFIVKHWNGISTVVGAIVEIRRKDNLHTKLKQAFGDVPYKEEDFGDDRIERQDRETLEQAERERTRMRVRPFKELLLKEGVTFHNVGGYSISVNSKEGQYLGNITTDEDHREDLDAKIHMVEYNTEVPREDSILVITALACGVAVVKKEHGGMQGVFC